MFRPVTDEDIRALETEIDRIDPLLAPLKQFILPGGTQGAAMLHVARSVCRRAERLVVSLSESEKVRGMIVVYMNRLSDLLFVLARWTNAQENRDEEQWTP
jgi:cob(I)alamin adenosyltransferase